MHYVGRNTRILGTGSYTPEKRVTNADLAQKVHTTSDWIFDNLGIRERRVAAENEFTSDLAVSAAINAIRDAGIDKNDIDLIIVATATPDRQAPSTACIVQHKLGITTQCPAFDISAVCSGFLYGMTLGSQFLATESCKNVLVIGADTFSRITDWNHRDCVFFGDGAGAIVMQAAPERHSDALFASALYADGSGQDAFTVYPGDTSFSMNGRAVYDTGSLVLPKAVLDLLAKHELSAHDITWIIPHQPSIRILKNMADTLGIPFEKVLTNMDRYANTSGATIPLLLDEANRSGKLKKSDLVVFAAVGSGWAWGATLYRW